MTNLVDYTGRFLNTAEAMDYTPDELDDLTSRKVEAVEFDGDALARIVRAREGAARYLGKPSGYGMVDATVRANLWDSLVPARGNRRLVASGRTVTTDNDRFIAAMHDQPGNWVQFTPLRLEED